MRIRQLATAITVVACMPALVQCSAGGNASTGEAGVVRFGSYQPSSLDPRKSGTLDAVFLTPVYDTLIHRTPGGDIEPRLAKEWKFSADGKSFDLFLRDDVKFHDGEKFDAAAVKANILAAKQPGAARAGELEAIESVEIVDDYHVRLHLSRPASQLIGVFAGEAGMMISPKALEDPDLATNPVGAGPYELTTFNQGELEYTAWDGYWNPEGVKNSKLDFVINADTNTQYRALKSGQLNFYELPLSLVEAAEQENLKVIKDQSTNLWQLLLNPSTPELANPDVRKAITLAIDRKAVSDSVFGGLCAPSVQPFAKGFLGHVDELDEAAESNDLGEARRLMAEAGYPNGFDVTLVHSTSSQQQNLGTVVQAELKKIGITVEIDAMDQAQSTARQREGQFDIAISLPPTGRPDPTTYFEWFYSKDGLYNHGFTHESVAPGLRAASATPEESKRQAALEKVVKAVYEAGGPTVPLCNSTRGYVMADNVSGFEVPKFNDWDWASIVVE